MDKEEYIEVRDSTDGIAKLMAAVRSENVGCTKELIESGTDIEARNKHGQTALMVAAEHGRVERIQTLVKLGANIEANNNRGQTALVYAAQNGRVGCIETLVKLEANIGAKDNRGQTALMISAANNRVYCIEKLVEFGANIEVRNEYGGTALMYAAGYGHVECMKILVELGADIEAEDKKGNTAITYFQLYTEGCLTLFIMFIEYIYKNYMNLNEAIIKQIEMHLYSCPHRESENYIKARMLLFQIKNSRDLKAKLTTGRDLFVGARKHRIQRIINFWKQEKWSCEARKAFVETIEKKSLLPPEIINNIFSFFLPIYFEGNIIFSKDILDASGGVIGAEEYSVMVTSYHCQESAEEIGELLRQEEKLEKKNIS